MSTETATLVAVEILRGADDAVNGENASSTTGGALKRAVVYFNTQGQLVTAGDTVSFNVGTAISGVLRDGKTIVIRYVAGWSNAADTNGNTYTMGSNTNLSLSTSTISFIPKVESDYSTNTGNISASVVFTRNWAVFVAYSDY